MLGRCELFTANRETAIRLEALLETIRHDPEFRIPCRKIIKYFPLYQMLIDHTPAARDQDHIDIVISSRASTPDRTAFIMGKSKDDPFAVMEQDGFSLVHYGATVLAIPLQHSALFLLRPPG